MIASSLMFEWDMKREASGFLEGSAMSTVVVYVFIKQSPGRFSTRNTTWRIVPLALSDSEQFPSESQNRWWR